MHSRAPWRSHRRLRGTAHWGSTQGLRTPSWRHVLRGTASPQTKGTVSTRGRASQRTAANRPAAPLLRGVCSAAGQTGGAGFTPSATAGPANALAGLVSRGRHDPRRVGRHLDGPTRARGAAAGGERLAGLTATVRLGAARRAARPLVRGALARAAVAGAATGAAGGRGVEGVLPVVGAGREGQEEGQKRETGHALIVAQKGRTDHAPRICVCAVYVVHGTRGR